MKMHINIKRVLRILLMAVIVTASTLLLLAAVRTRDGLRCSGSRILINGSEEGEWFVNKKDITEILTSNQKVVLKGRHINDFDLASVERKLESLVWISDAELFFDNNGLLEVRVRERVPVARVFTSMGTSFYIDTACKRLPVSTTAFAKVPVFTGFPSNSPRLKNSDRQLLRDISRLSRYIMNDKFWMSQVSQVDITAEKQFEIIPVVGNHVIEFGDISNAENKFSRIHRLYKNILTVNGIDKYKRIKAQYENQIIGVKANENTSTTDK
jgi:cell division protein FtsQ